MNEQQDDELDCTIRSFDDLQINKDPQEFMKPFSFEMFVRDSDDVC